MKLLTATLSVILLLYAATTLAGTQPAKHKYMALVIDNTDSPANPTQQTAPEKMARALAGKLASMGFEVTAKENLKLDDFKAALNKFYKSSEGGTMLLYFSGAGFLEEGKSYLFPADTACASWKECVQVSIPLNPVVETLGKTGPQQKIIILDAFLSGSEQRPVNLPEAPNTLLAFAAQFNQPGSVDMEPGDYTAALLRHLDASAAFVQVLQRARNDVARQTENRQIPWIAGKLPQLFTLPSRLSQQFDASTPPFRDCQQCPEMVVIPAGSFYMGSNDGYDSEKPLHIATVGKPFALGKFEVTQAQWRAIMGNDPGHFSGCDDCAAEQVSWEDAQEYIRKLNEKTGKQYRLPSEAEWEYACYGGSRAEHCGSNDVNAVAWYDSNSMKQTHPAGRKQPNGYGLHDMSGNVWEWVADSHHGSYAGAPTDGSAWQGGDEERRMLRGGSWLNDALSARAAYRFGSAATDRSSSYGFRVARTLP